MKRFLFSALFSFIASSRLQAAVRPVCSTCTYTTIAAAYAAAGSTDVIELREDIANENLTVGKNIAGIRGDFAFRKWNGTGDGASQTLTITNGLTQPFYVRDLVIDHNSGLSQTIFISGLSIGNQVRFEHCALTRTSASAADTISVDPGPSVTANQLVFSRCSIFAQTSRTGLLFNNMTLTNGVMVENCMLHGTASGWAVKLQGSSSNQVIRFYHNLFEGAQIALEIFHRCDARNNLFISNTQDLNRGAPANVADFSYNGWGQEPSAFTGFGAGNISINSTAFVNTAGQDWRLAAGAAPINAGASLAGTWKMAADRWGNPRVQGSAPDMGPNERSPHDWRFEQSADGWNVALNSCSQSVTNGVMVLNVTATDPWVQGPINQAINAATERYFKVKMRHRTTDTVARVYFATTAGSFSQPLSLSFTVVASDTVMREYVVDMSQNASWTGSINQLRLDIADSGLASTGGADIDFIRITDEPGAPADCPAYTLLGNAVSAGPGGVTLTASLGGQAGAAWLPARLDLDKAFSKNYRVYLGADPNGADGIAFVMQADPAGAAALGPSGGAIAYLGISPSVAVVFKTFFTDNLQIWEGGVLSAACGTCTYASGELCNGSYHNFTLSWDPLTQLLSCTLDGIPALSYSRDLVNDVFGGLSSVQFGFTAATGGNTNVQAVRDGACYGNGLLGQYFNGANFDTFAGCRTDNMVNFSWGGANPGAGLLKGSNFSALWTGTIKPLYSEMTTFSVNADDGVRLWVNNVQLVNYWKQTAAITNSGAIALAAGVDVPVRLEYFQGAGGSNCTLSWQSASLPLQAIPQSQLYSPDCGGLPIPTPMPTATPFTPQPLKSDPFDSSKPFASIWTAKDIGLPTTPGSYSEAASLSVTSLGFDIWNDFDEGYMAYQTVSGSVDVTLQVNSVPANSPWSKSGIMIRAMDSPDSAYAFAFASRSNNYNFQARASKGGFAFGIGGSVGTYVNNTPGWVRLRYNGTSFQGFYSQDGVNWVSMGSAAFAMPAAYMIGPAVTAGDGALQGLASYNNFAIAPTPTPVLSSVAYRELFPNNTLGSLDLSSAGWGLARGAFGTAVAATAANMLICGMETGMPIGEAPVNSFPANGAIDTGYLSDFNGAATGQIELLYTTEASIDRSLYEISGFRWGIEDTSMNDVQRIAIRIAGNWYASQQVFIGTGACCGAFFGTLGAVMELDFKSAVWNQLNFTPGTALNMGGVVALPAGNADGFGILVDNRSAQVRIDNYSVIVRSLFTATPTITQTYTVSPTSTWTPTGTPTATPTPSPTWSPTWTQTGTPTWTPTSSPTASQTWTPTASPTWTPTPSPTWSPTITLTPTPTWSPTSTPTWTPTITKTSTPTWSPTASPTWTPTITLTVTPTWSPTMTPTWSPTATQSSTATWSPSATKTPTQTWTPTFTPTWTPTITPTVTPTWSPTMTPTFTPSASPTSTPSASLTPSWTPTASPSSTPSATVTATPSTSPSSTPTASSTATPTASPSLTASPSATPSATPSASPTQTATLTATMTHSPTITLTSSPTASHTLTTSPTPTATFTHSPTATASPTASASPSPSGTLTQSPTISATSTQSPVLSATPTAGAIKVTLRIYDSSGALLRTLDGGSASGVGGSITAQPRPWDPSASPLTVGDGAWSAPFNGKDSQGDYLPNGSYLVEAEFTGNGGSRKLSAGFSVLRGGRALVSAIAWPNPAGKGSAFVMLAWAPAALEVKGQIFNQAGELVSDLGLLKGGAARWELKGLSDGVYFVALRVDGERQPRLLKVALTR